MSESNKMPSGPPYPPMTAGVGGRPSVDVDVPICAVFLALFVGGAVGHMSLFRLNLRRRGHKFVASAATFGFCMARISASVLRIAWATHLTNVSVAIAAQVLVYAGVLLLYILNLLFVQRMLRAAAPSVGWSRPATWFVRGICALVVVSLIMLIVASVQSFYTLDPDIRDIDADLRLYGICVFTFVAFLPLPVLTYVLFVLSTRAHHHHHHQNEDEDKDAPTAFGSGSWTARALIVGFSCALLTLGAGFKLGTYAMPARAPNNPAWYHHKACFYIFNFGVEVVVVYLWLLGRVDRRFWVPDGSSKVRSYRGREKGEEGEEGEKRDAEQANGESLVSGKTAEAK